MFRSFVRRAATGRQPAVTLPPAAIERDGNTAVAKVNMPVVARSCGVEFLAELLVDLEESGAKDIVLDIENVEYMDSACLACLVEASNRVADVGGRIAIVNPAYRVNYLFKLTRLDHVFRICSDVSTAVETMSLAKC